MSPLWLSALARAFYLLTKELFNSEALGIYLLVKLQIFLVSDTLRLSKFSKKAQKQANRYWNNLKFMVLYNYGARDCQTTSLYNIETGNNTLIVFKSP